jgi:hypothetical protein
LQRIIGSLALDGGAVDVLLKLIRVGIVVTSKVINIGERIVDVGLWPSLAE